MEKNWNTVYIVISFLANKKDSAAFTNDILRTWYGDNVAFARGKKKAAKKAIKRIRGDYLNDEDIAAMERIFLDELKY